VKRLQRRIRISASVFATSFHFAASMMHGRGRKCGELLKYRKGLMEELSAIEDPIQLIITLLMAKIR
jgi:hypothetical protein